MKKGFTLIELLAVIVILAIIALIAAPVVVNIINDSKKESINRSIELYMDAVQKRITVENMKVKYDPDRCDIQDNGNVKCYSGAEVIKTSTGEEELVIEMNGKKPESGTITIENNKITYSGLVLEGMEYTLGKPPKEYVPPIPATEEDYRGYYADVDGDGEADGIIYADLSQDDNGEWGIGVSGVGEYSYTAQAGLKEYIVSSKKYKANEGFGTKSIISVKKGSSGTSRFYVMALEDFRTGSFEAGNRACYNGNDCEVGTYYWYKNASRKMNESDTSTDFGEGYNNTGKIIGIWKKNGEGTESYTGATQDDNDIWKHIQGEYEKGWYIPTGDEWAAFADYFKITSDHVTGSYIANSGNYKSLYGLSDYYWSSLQLKSDTVAFVDFSIGVIEDNNVNDYNYVRLGATF